MSGVCSYIRPCQGTVCFSCMDSWPLQAECRKWPARSVALCAAAICIATNSQHKPLVATHWCIPAPLVRQHQAAAWYDWSSTKCALPTRYPDAC